MKFINSLHIIEFWLNHSIIIGKMRVKRRSVYRVHCKCLFSEGTTVEAEQVAVRGDIRGPQLREIVWTTII